MSDALTTVSYDVSAAISALEQLDDKVKSSGKTAEDAFNKSGAASSRYESNVSGLANALTSGAGATAIIANQTLELAENIGQAAEKAGEFTQMIAEQGFGFESATKQIDEFIARMDSIAATVQGAIDIGNAATNAAVQRQLFLTSRSQLAVERNQIAANAAEQQGLSIRLSANKQFYSELESIANKSAQKRTQAEDQLSQIVASTNERRFLASIARFSNNAQISKIIDQANSLEKQGGKENLQSAEDLLNKALQKAQDSGNAGQVKKVEEGFDNLIKKRGEDAVAATKQADTDKAAAEAAKKVTESIVAQSIALKENSQVIQQRVQAAAADRAEAKRRQEDNVKNQEFQKAELDIRKNLVELNKVDNQPISPLSRIPSPTNVLKEITIPEGDVAEQRRVLDEAKELEEKISARANKDSTPGGIKNLAPAVAQLKAVLAEVQDIPNLSSTLVPDVDKLQRAVDLYDRLQKSAEAAAAASGKLNGQGPDALPPIRPNAPTSNDGGTSTSTITKQVTQNIQVDLSVKGGMIDSDTISQITERVSREIRKGTVQA